MFILQHSTAHNFSRRARQQCPGPIIRRQGGGADWGDRSRLSETHPRAYCRGRSTRHIHDKFSSSEDLSEKFPRGVTRNKNQCVSTKTPSEGKTCEAHHKTPRGDGRRLRSLRRGRRESPASAGDSAGTSASSRSAVLRRRRGASDRGHLPRTATSREEEGGRHVGRLQRQARGGLHATHHGRAGQQSAVLLPVSRPRSNRVRLLSVSAHRREGDGTSDGGTGTDTGGWGGTCTRTSTSTGTGTHASAGGHADCGSLRIVNGGGIRAQTRSGSPAPTVAASC